MLGGQQGREAWRCGLLGWDVAWELPAARLPGRGLPPRYECCVEARDLGQAWSHAG